MFNKVHCNAMYMYKKKLRFGSQDSKQKGDHKIPSYRYQATDTKIITGMNQWPNTSV